MTISFPKNDSMGPLRSLRSDPINHVPLLCVESPVSPFPLSNPSAAVFHQAGPPYHRWSFNPILHNILHHLHLKNALLRLSSNSPSSPHSRSSDAQHQETCLPRSLRAGRTISTCSGSCSIHAMLNGPLRRIIHHLLHQNNGRCSFAAFRPSARRHHEPLLPRPRTSRHYHRRRSNGRSVSCPPLLKQRTPSSLCRQYLKPIPAKKGRPCFSSAQRCTACGSPAAALPKAHAYIRIASSRARIILADSAHPPRHPHKHQFPLQGSSTQQVTYCINYPPRTTVALTDENLHGPKFNFHASNVDLAW